MEFYCKNENGKYWFEEIPANEYQARRSTISTSIMEYFNCMVNTRHVTAEMTNEYSEYIRVLQTFLKEN
jgi:hypothetical protein